MQSDGEVLDPISKDEEADDVAVARFLRTCPGLSKSIVGDLLGQNTERCLRILDAFTHMFDFSGEAFGAVCLPALRSWLGSILQNSASAAWQNAILYKAHCKAAGLLL